MIQKYPYLFQIFKSTRQQPASTSALWKGFLESEVPLLHYLHGAQPDFQERKSRRLAEGSRKSWIQDADPPPYPEVKLDAMQKSNILLDILVNHTK